MSTTDDHQDDEPLGAQDAAAAASSSGRKAIEEEHDTVPEFILKDRFGFFLSDEFHKYMELPTEVLQARKDKEGRRALKWVHMLKKWEQFYQPGKGNHKMKSRVRKGIPDVVRGYSWYHYADSSVIQQRYPNAFAIDISQVSRTTLDEVSEKQIKINKIK